MNRKEIILLIIMMLLAATLAGCTAAPTGKYVVVANEAPYGFPGTIEFFEDGLCSVDGMSGLYQCKKDTLMLSAAGQILLYRYSMPDKSTLLLQSGAESIMYVPPHPAQSAAPDDMVKAAINVVSEQVFDAIQSNTSDSFSSNRALSCEQLGISHSWMPGDVEDVVTAKLAFDTETMRQMIAVCMYFDWNEANAWEQFPSDFRVESMDFSPLCGIWEAMDGSGHRITVYEAGSIDIAAGESETNVYLTHDLTGPDVEQGTLSITFGRSTASIVGMTPSIDVPMPDANFSIIIGPRELHVCSVDYEALFQRVGDAPTGALPD